MDRVKPNRFSGKCERGQHIFACQPGMSRKEVINAAAAGKRIKDVLDSQAGAANTRLPEHHRWIANDAVVFHSKSISD